MKQVRGSAFDAAKAGDGNGLHSRIMPIVHGEHGTCPLTNEGGKLFFCLIHHLPPACGEHMISSRCHTRSMSSDAVFTPFSIDQGVSSDARIRDID